MRPGYEEADVQVPQSADQGTEVAREEMDAESTSADRSRPGRDCTQARYACTFFTKHAFSPTAIPSILQDIS